MDDNSFINYDFNNAPSSYTDTNYNNKFLTTLLNDGEKYIIAKRDNYLSSIMIPQLSEDVIEITETSASVLNNKLKALPRVLNGRRIKITLNRGFTFDRQLEICNFYQTVIELTQSDGNSNNARIICKPFSVEPESYFADISARNVSSAIYIKNIDNLILNGNFKFSLSDYPRNLEGKYSVFCFENVKNINGNGQIDISGSVIPTRATIFDLYNKSYCGLNFKNETFTCGIISINSVYNLDELKLSSKSIIIRLRECFFKIIYKPNKNANYS
jgi:hypothetical protein